MIKAIDTYYNGYYFRSRTEARWAVFFDTMRIKYEYEKEGYELPSGNYLPDFFLPEYGIFAEVKGRPFTEEEKNKCKELAICGASNVAMLEGQPDFKEYNCYHFENIIAGYTLIGDDWKTWYEPLVSEHQAVVAHDGLRWNMGYYREEDFWFGYREAIFKSRSARFEFQNRSQCI